MRGRVVSRAKRTPRTKKLAAAFAALVLAVCCTGAAFALGGIQQESAWDGTSAQEWSQGSGTAADPFVIDSAAQLKYLANMVNSGESTFEGVYFQLGCDIDLNDMPWVPIGIKPYADSSSSNKCFSGVFLGEGHSVEGLNVTVSTNNSAYGLFGYTYSALIESVMVYGNVSCAQSTAGSNGTAGLVGCLNKSSAIGCGNYAQVSGYQNVGGIVGYATGASQIDECLNAGAISGTVYGTTGKYASGVGGIVGKMGNTSLSNSYNTGAVQARYFAGGLAGVVTSAYMSDQSINVANCYNAGTVSSDYSTSSTRYEGALFGQVYNNNYDGQEYEAQNKLSNCYALAGSAAKLYSTESTTGGFKITSVKEVSAQTMASQDFLSTLNAGGNSFIQGSTYPLLAWQNGSGYPIVRTQPSDASYSMGAAAEPLVVEAVKPSTGTGWDGVLSYQWYRYAQGDAPENAVALEGAAEASLTPDTSVAGAWYYYCRITNTFGESAPSVDSAAALVSVTDDRTAAVPAVSYSQDSYSFAENAEGAQMIALVQVADDASAACGAVTYRWQVSPDGADDSWSDAEGQDTALGSDGKAVLSPSLGSLGTLYYRCVVTNTVQGSKVAVGKGAAVAVTVTAGTVISNASDLAAYAAAVNAGTGVSAHAVLTADVDLSQTVWTPIGTESHPFAASFDGQGHVVTLNIAGEDAGAYAGLFGCAKGASISNVVVAGSVAGGSYVGGVCAYASDSTTIQSCGNEASIAAAYTLPESTASYKDHPAGGIVGYLGASSCVRNCYNRAAVSAPAQVGGIAGYAVSEDEYGLEDHLTTIAACYNAGTISMTQEQGTYIGGILGSARNAAYSQTQQNQGMHVSACYNAGYVQVPAGCTNGLWGAIQGSGSSAGYSAACSGCSYLTGCLTTDGQPLDDKGQNQSGDAAANEALTGAAMLSDSYIDSLNALAGKGTFTADEDDANAGYPRLSWEKMDAVQRCSYTVTVDVPSAAVVVRDFRGRTRAVVSSVATDSNLTCTFELPVWGQEYTYEVSAEGYLTEEGSFTVSAEGGQGNALDIRMYGRHFAVTAAAADSVTGDAIPAGNVTLSLSQGGVAIEPGEDGAYSVLPGTYAYSVSAPGYNSAQGSVTWERDESRTQAVIDEKLVPCAHVGFQVKDGEGSVVDSFSSCVFAVDEQGSQTLFAQGESDYVLPDGTYRYWVQARGCERAAADFTVEGGLVYESGQIIPLGDRSHTFQVALSALQAWDGATVQEPMRAEGVYQISNAAELAWFAQQLNNDAFTDDSPGDGLVSVDAVLTDDIKLNGDDSLVNRWEPIGYCTSSDARADADYLYYAGTFDGQGHVVSGLYAVGSKGMGLFGAIGTGAVVKNVVVSGFVSASTYAGAICGYADGACTIRNCGSHAVVRGTTGIGGIAGGHNSGSGTLTVRGCYNKGTVDSQPATTRYGEESSAGGICGMAYTTSIESCYNAGTITANGYAVGGLAGSSTADTFVANSYNAGAIDWTYTSAGGSYLNALGAICGVTNAQRTDSMCTNSYWLAGCGASVAIGADDSGTAPSQTGASSFTSTDGLSASALNGGGGDWADSSEGYNSGFARLAWEDESLQVPAVPDNYQAGTADHPWLIEDVDDLVSFAAAVEGGTTYSGQYVKLAADLDLSGIAFSGIGHGFTGSYATSQAVFAGIFDGDGHTVSGLQISNTGDAGFFAYLRGATVKNLRLEGSVAGASAINTGAFVGGLAGQASYSTITDCVVSADVSNNQGDASTIGGLGGIVGHAYASNLTSNLFLGKVSDPSASGSLSMGAIATYSKGDGDQVLAANYYLGTDEEGYPAGICRNGVSSDEEGESSAVTAAELDSDELAWILNTANSTRANAGVWGNSADVCFASEQAPAIYRVVVASKGIRVTLNREYVPVGGTVSFSGFAARKGYILSSGLLATTVGADKRSAGNVFQGDAGQAEGSFTMVASDVDITAEVAFDPSTAFLATAEVVSADDQQRSATVSLSAQSTAAGTSVQVDIANVDATSRVQAVRAVCADDTAEEVPVTAVSIGSRYTFSMPAADVKVQVVLTDISVQPQRWASEGILTKAKHIYAGGSYISDGGYMTSLVAVDGDANSGVVYHDSQTYASQWYLGMGDIEGSATQRYQYRASYSTLDEDGVLFQQTYQGFLLYDYLVANLGLPDNLADDVKVTLWGEGSQKIQLTIGQLKSTDYNAYDADGNKVAEGLPVILAYAQGNDAFQMDVAHSNATGSMVSYAQRTPFMLVMGQTSASDKNASTQLFGVRKIYIGEGEPSNQHWTAPYSDYLDQAITINVYEGDAASPKSTTKMTLSELEQYYSQNPSAQRLDIVTGSQFSTPSTGGYADAIQCNETDTHDGVALWNLLVDKGIVTSEDAASTDSTATFVSDDQTQRCAVTTVPLQYLAGGEDGSHLGNVLDYGGLSVTGVAASISYSKNGYPLVYTASSTGYINDEYNRYGPFMAVLPANSAYGVYGVDSYQEYDSDTGSYETYEVENDALIVAFMSGIDIHLAAADSSTVDVPQPDKTSFTYNGSVQGIQVPASVAYQVSGDVSATDAGDYKAVFTLAAGYMWADGTTDAKTIEWKIEKASRQAKASTNLVNVAVGGTASFGIEDAAEDGTVEVACLDEDIAWVVRNGQFWQVLGAKQGSTAIRVSLTGSKNYADAIFDIPVAVGVQYVDGSSDVAVSLVGGNVQVSVGGAAVPAAMYTTTYYADEACSAAIAPADIEPGMQVYAKVSFKGSWAGSVVIPVLAKGSLSSAKVQVAATCAYTGKALKPAVAVQGSGAKLKEGQDYSLSYSNNIACGVAKVIVSGKGAWVGTATATFTVVPTKVAKPKLSSPAKGKVKVKWNAKLGKAAKATGYRVVITCGSKVVKRIFVKGAAKSKTVCKLAAKYRGKKVRVKVTAYKTVSGKKMFGAASAASKIVKVKK